MRTYITSPKYVNSTHFLQLKDREDEDNIQTVSRSCVVETDSGSCPTAGFGISGTKPLSSAQ